MTAQGAALGDVSHHNAKPQRGDPNAASTHDARDRVGRSGRFRILGPPRWGFAMLAVLVSQGCALS